MSNTYGFDDHKNKILLYEHEPSVITLGTTLSDNSVIAYDRGSNYGEYSIVNNTLIRLTEGDDDGTPTSQNWRFLIIEEKDASKLGDCYFWTQKQPVTLNDGLQERNIGYGLNNTNFIINYWMTNMGNDPESEFNQSYLAGVVNMKRLQTTYDWFVPSGLEASAIVPYMSNINNNKFMVSTVLDGYLDYILCCYSNGTSFTSLNDITERYNILLMRRY